MFYIKKNIIFKVKQTISVCFLLFVLFLSACSDENKTQETEQKQAQEQAVNVVTEQFEAKDVPYPMEYTGQTAGYKQVEVRAQVNGILLKKNYVEGALVKAGDILFEIDSSSYQAILNKASGELNSAEAIYQQRKLDYDRAVKLFSEDVISKKERDDAVGVYESSLGTVESARGAVEEAKINLGYTKVQAPITGLTGREQVSEGNLITASNNLLTTIVQVDPFYVNFAVSDNDMLTITNLYQNGKLILSLDNKYLAKITLSNGQRYNGEGEVDFIGHQVNPNTGSVNVRALFSNPDGKILPGQFARIAISGALLKNAILIPQKAVMETAKGSIVYIIDKDKKTIPKVVKIAMNIGTNYVISEGLSSGDELITEGILKVRPGNLVNVVPAAAPAIPVTNTNQ